VAGVVAVVAVGSARSTRTRSDRSFHEERIMKIKSKVCGGERGCGGGGGSGPISDNTI